MMEEWVTIQEFGNTPPIDIYPWMKLIPECFLGMWNSRAQSISRKMNSLYNEFLNIVIDRRKDRGSRDCFVDRMLDQEKKFEFTRHQQYFLTGTLLEGGSDTTASVMTAFMHAMTKWPDVQKKAQTEIDAIVSDNRLPDWEDYGNMPYVASVVKETMRWRPVAPLGFPHALTEGRHLVVSELERG